MCSPRVLLPTGLVHEAPFETTGEAGTSSSTKTRVLDGLDDPRVAFEENILGFVPVTARLEQALSHVIRRKEVWSGTHHGALDTMVMSAVRVGEDTVLVLQSAVVTNGRVLDCSESPAQLSPQGAGYVYNNLLICDEDM